MVKFGLKVKNKMSEFFLELFSEEIPANLQKKARNNLLQIFKDFFEKKNISFNNLVEKISFEKQLGKTVNIDDVALIKNSSENLRISIHC